MLRRIFIAAIFIAFAGHVALAQPRTLHALSWIAGDWESKTVHETIEEHWTLPVDDSMIGMSRTVQGQTTRAFEFIRLIQRDGEIYYVASPNARKVAEFKLIELDAQHAVFQGGDEHVQRVIYRRNGPDGLSARIEGTADGKPFAEDYNYTRQRR